MKDSKKKIQGGHDAVIQLVTVCAPRDEVPKILRARRITVDKLVGYRYMDPQGNQIELVYTTGRLPAAHECQARIPMADRTALGIWERYDHKLQFFTVFNQGDAPAEQFRLDMLVMDELVRVNGMSADYLDTVFPLKDLNRVTQYALHDDRLVAMNPEGRPGLNMVRVDRVNRYVLALATDEHGTSTCLVGMEADRLKDEPDLLSKPEAWTRLVETNRGMNFFSRPDNTGLITQIAINFEDSKVRALLMDHSASYPMVKWEGEAKDMGYYMVGHLAGKRDILVGYTSKDADSNVELRFTPREQKVQPLQG